MSDLSTPSHNYDIESEPELDDEAEQSDTPVFWERQALKLRAFRSAPSMSLMEAAGRGLRWAIRRLAALARPTTSATEAALTEADKRFLTWLAQAAVALYLSEKQSTAEG